MHSPPARPAAGWPLIDIGLPDLPVIPGLVSVVIPTFNRAQQLALAIRSALDQTDVAVEVVVADDGSTDDTAAVVAQMGGNVRRVYQRNAGVSAARNLGLRHVRGEFVAFLDSDDRWVPWKAAAQVAVLRARPDVGMVWSDMAAIGPDGTRRQDRYLRTLYHAYRDVTIEQMLERPATLRELWQGAPAAIADVRVLDGQIISSMILGNLVHTSTVMLRRSWLAELGGFDERLRVSGEDYDFHLRTASLGRVAFVDASTTEYRIGADDQLTASDKTIYIARNNLQTILGALEAVGSRLQIPRRVLRDRMANAYAWLGGEELERGDTASARRALLSSLRFRVDRPRTVVLLLLTLLPGIGRVAAIRLNRVIRHGWRRVAALMAGITSAG
jgi:glycosyltransferase involved in cell wall biosynthesis